GRGEAGIVEVVAPAIGGGKPLPQPSMETERRELRRLDRRDQHLLLARRNEPAGLGQPGKAGVTKQIGLGSDEVHFSGISRQRDLMWEARCLISTSFQALRVLASHLPFGLDR